MEIQRALQNKNEKYQRNDKTFLVFDHEPE